MSKSRNRGPVSTTIDTLHPDGYGIGEAPRLAIFGALPGEQVVAIPMAKRKKWLYARAETIAQPNADRVEPRCTAAGVCGGCSLQHMAPQAQLSFKLARIAALFEDCPPRNWLPPLSENVYHYRNKARLGVKYVEKKGGVLVGFREKMKPFIAQTSSCPVLCEPIASMIEPLARMIEDLSVASLVPQIEVAVGDEKAALVFRHLEPLDSADLERLSAFGLAHGIDIYLQPGGPDSVVRLHPDDGTPDRLHYSLPAFDLTLAFHPMDFTQVNPAINRRMVQRAVELLALTPADSVLDAFCGIGNFSLALARQAKFVTGIEGVDVAVQRAGENAAANGIKNAQFLTRDLFDENVVKQLEIDANKIVLDPPRNGAEALCKKLASTTAERVVYVSCNVATLARDVRILVENGFAFEQLGAIDMFPHTTHVESMALLTR